MTNYIEKNTAIQVNSEMIGVQVSPDIIPNTSKIDVVFSGEVVKISTSFDGVHYMLSTVDGDIYYNGSNELEVQGEKYVEILAYGYRPVTYETLWAKRNSFFEIRRNDDLYDITGNPGEEVVTQVAKVNMPFGDINTGYAMVAGEFEGGYYIADANGFINSDKSVYMSIYNQNDIRAIVIDSIGEQPIPVTMFKTSDTYDDTHKKYKGHFPVALFPGEENAIGQYSGLSLDFSVLYTEGHPAVDDNVTYIAKVPYSLDAISSDLTGSVTETYADSFKTVTADLNCWYVEVSDRVMIDGVEKLIFRIALVDSDDQPQGECYVYQTDGTLDYDDHTYYQYAKYAGDGEDIYYALSPAEESSGIEFYVYDEQTMELVAVGWNQGSFNDIPSPNNTIIYAEQNQRYYSQIGTFISIDGKLFLTNWDSTLRAVVSVSNPNYLISNVIFNYRAQYDRGSYVEVEEEIPGNIFYGFNVDTTEGHPVVGDVMEADSSQIPNTATIKSIVYGDPESVNCQVSYSVRGDNFTDVGNPLTDENNVICNIPRYIYLKFTQDVDITEE